MGLWSDQVVPRLVGSSLDQPAIHDVRRRACAHLAGEVIELGFGSGLNVAHYPSGVARVRGVEPSAVARRLAEPAVRASTVPVGLDDADAQRLPYPDSSFDAALVTFTLCAIDDAPTAARELFRVLRPGGTVAYAEHGASPDPGVLRWQRRLAGLHRAVAGCRPDRCAPDLLAEAGFVVGPTREHYLPGAPRWAGYVYEGSARRL